MVIVDAVTYPAEMVPLITFWWLAFDDIMRKRMTLRDMHAEMSV